MSTFIYNYIQILNIFLNKNQPFKNLAQKAINKKYIYTSIYKLNHKICPNVDVDHIINQP